MNRPSPLTVPQRRALAALRDACDTPMGTAQQPLGYASPKTLARALWPDSVGWEKRSNRRSTPAGGALGATMPMKAATLLHRLRVRGLVTEVHDGLWGVTPLGLRVLAGTAEPLPAPGASRTSRGTLMRKPKRTGPGVDTTR